MSSRTTLVIAIVVLATSVCSAHAQLAIPWFTIDGGGGVSSGGVFTVSGTIGQHDAGPSLAGASFAVAGGFWVGAPTQSCPADFNQSGGVTVQDIYDYLAAWNGQAGQSGTGLSADFNASGTVTVQDIYDFLGAWNAGCP